MEQIKCSNCGQVTDSSNKFCVKCGTKINNAKILNDEYDYLYNSPSGMAIFFIVLACILGLSIIVFLIVTAKFVTLGLIGAVSSLFACLFFCALAVLFTKINTIENTVFRIERKLR